MVYKKTIKMTDHELNYYKDLLELDLEDLDEHDMERLGAKKDDYITIKTIEFDNGNYITLDLASGKNNYYDNIVLWDKNGNELSCNDCNFYIDSFSLYYDEDIYDVEIEVI